MLCKDEKELGVALVDIGGGTTDIAIFVRGSVVHTGVIAIGGNHVTNDIAVGLRTSLQEAENVKISAGCAMASMLSSETMIEVPGIGGRKPARGFEIGSGENHRATAGGDFFPRGAGDCRQRIPAASFFRGGDHGRVVAI